MDKKLIRLIFLFFLVFSLFITVVIFNEPLSQITRAKEDSLPSTEKSLIFAWPLDSNVNNQVTVSVFVRNNKGVPLANKNVILQSTLGEVSPKFTSTDANGKASFNLVSINPGISELSAIVEGSSLKQKVSIKFQ